MARYIAGKPVKVGGGHFNPGEPLPADVEGVAGFAACVADGTFLVVGEPAKASSPEPQRPVELTPAHPVKLETPVPVTVTTPKPESKPEARPSPPTKPGSRFASRNRK